MHPLIRSCFLLHVLGRLSLLDLSHLLGTCHPSLWSLVFSPALGLIFLSLAKVRRSLTLTLSCLMIWYSGLTDLLLFLLAKSALAYLPSALSMALRPLFPFQQAQLLKFLCRSLRHSARSLLVSAAPSSLSFFFSFPLM